ncbi:MAG: MFS transporter [Clostridium sp.]
MKNNKIHYGWLIVLACSTIMFSSYGIINNCASLFFKVVSESIEVSRTEFSMYYTISGIALVCIVPFVGSIFKRFGTRPTMIFATILSSGAFVGFSMVENIKVFYILGAMQGLGLGMLTIIPVSIITNNWFHKKKGLALGLVMTGAGLGGLIFNPVTNFIIQNYGWRNAYLILGIVSAVITLPIIFLIYRSPDEKGMKSYGIEDEHVYKKVDSSGLKIGEAVRTPSFWLLCIGMFAFCIGSIGIQMHIPSYLTDISFSTNMATSIVTIYLAAAVPFRVLMGVVFDRVGCARGVIIGGIVMISCQVILLNITSYPVAILFAVIYGYGICMGTVATPILVANIFGNEEYGKIIGLVNVFPALGAAIGPLISSTIFDNFGSYTYAWVGYIGLTIIMIITVLISIYLINKKTSQTVTPKTVKA